MAKDQRTRVSALRKARLDAGWAEVRLWVASKSDAEEIRNHAEELMMKTIDSSLRSFGDENNISVAVVDSTLDAIHAQNSRVFTSPSGATLELLTNLLRAGAVRDANAAYLMFAKAHPGNARHVAGQIPGKVLNRYLLSKLDFRGADRFIAWQKERTGWADDVLHALEHFALDAWADRVVEEIRAVDA